MAICCCRVIVLPRGASVLSCLCVCFWGARQRRSRHHAGEATKKRWGILRFLWLIFPTVVVTSRRRMPFEHCDTVQCEEVCPGPPRRQTTPSFQTMLVMSVQLSSRPGREP